MQSLNFKQRLFVEAYIGEANGNATEAARIAGYAHPNTQGPRLLVNVCVQAQVARRLSCAALAANEVLARVSDIASADVLDFVEFDDSGEWTVSLKLTKRRGKGHVIRKLKKGELGTEIELRDSLAALIKIGEYHNLWNREKPPEVSLVQLAQLLKEKYERIGGMGDTDGSSGQVPEQSRPVQ